MRPSHRLDVLAIPADPTARPVQEAEQLRARLLSEGVLAQTGPGPEAHRWVAGGFRRWWVDDPGAISLYSNRQGGFSVWCPRRPEVITAAFNEAVSAMRDGGPRTLRCPACDEVHGLDEVQGKPVFAFGTVAIVTSDALAASLTPWAVDLLQATWGATRFVLRRG